METGSVGRAVYEFKTDIEGELPLEVGDVVQVLQVVDKYWLYGVSNKGTGNFPSGFVLKLEVPPVAEDQQLFAAMESFAAQLEDDLEFRKGDLIIGEYPLDSNWWHGQCNGRSGIFPLTHVWKLDMSSLKPTAKQKNVCFKVRIKMDMKAQLPEEMDLKKGEIITVTEVVDKWYRGEGHGKSGMFPASFAIKLEETDSEEKISPIEKYARNDGKPLEILEPEINDTKSFSAWFTKSLNENIYYDLDSSSESKHVGYHNKNSGITPYGKTQFPFTAQYPNELSFDCGVLLKLIRHVDDEWMEGEIDGKIGLFPTKYVDIVVDCNDSENVCFDNSDLENQLYKRGKVLYDFMAQVEGDLNLKEGEMITILKQLNPHWYQAKKDDGNVGICPSNFVRITANDGFPCESKSDDVFPQESLLTSLNEEKYAKEDWNQFLNPSDYSETKEPFKVSSHGTSLEAPEVFQPLSSCSNTISSERQSKDSQYERSCLNQTTGIKSPQISEDENPVILRNTHGFSSVQNSAPVQPSSKKEVVDAEPNQMHALRVPHRPAPPVPTFSSQSSQIKHGVSSASWNQATSMEDNNKNIKDETDGLKDSIEYLSYDVQRLVFKEPKEIDDTMQHTEALKEEEDNKNKETEDHRQKMEALRKNVIRELLQTEQDYVRDLEICRDVFLRDPSVGKRKGIDMETLFGNLDEVIEVASKLLENFEKEVTEKSPEEQNIGKCFLEFAEDLKQTYGQYCRNHDDVLVLIEKYEDNQMIKIYINQGVMQMRAKTNCFDLSSVLIKPVQRILKYPLLLDELIKCTENSHPSKADLEKADLTMYTAAKEINEFKRRKDLVFKYRKDTDTSLSTRISKLNLHSVKKKSSRFSAKLSTTLGLTSVPKDEAFEAIASEFHSLEKTIKGFLKNVSLFTEEMQSYVHVALSLTEDIADYYQDKRNQQEVDQYRATHHIMVNQFWEDFKVAVRKNVTVPLNNLLTAYHGPNNLIQKRGDKYLDYEACNNRLEPNKDAAKQRILQEELQEAKNNYIALNSQLLDELPSVCAISRDIFKECLHSFLQARKTLLGRTAKQMLSLTQLSLLLSSQKDILETFQIKHNLVVDQLTKLSLVPKHLFPSSTLTKTSSGKRSSSSCGSNVGISHNRQGTVPGNSQSPNQKAFIKSKYLGESLYYVEDNYIAVDVLDISVNKGDVVGVIKQQDPMGSEHRWFIDNGSVKGFVPAKVLAKFSQVSNSTQVNDYSDRYQTSFHEEKHSPHTKEDVSPHDLSVQEEPTSLNSDAPSNSSTDLFVYENIDTKRLDHSNLIAPSLSKLPSDESGNYCPGFQDHLLTQQISTSESEDQTPVVSQSYSEEPFENLEIEYYYAAYPFGAMGPYQLTLALGQVVVVLHKGDLEGNPEWWFVGDRFGNEGYVPSSYLKKYTD
ncbi:dynamin-binding protein-like isoform X2 [Limulus polyphemus]|nr:dynamin-binding protein-like isoform X2 [Limulus polyphemus]XP_022241442.1 dynamin-binding protein-like isoform X2 [Limulus polyphemus]XP_022241443.1 dynamin-binding protein-like isoform X2 [Limulus polyphemus]